MKHFLFIQPQKRGMRWWCKCGKGKGTGPTEEACEVSYDRHMFRLRIRRRGVKVLL